MPAPAVTFVEGLDINPDAYERLAEILKKKNVRLDYGNIVYSVANYAIVYPPFPPAKE